MAEEQALSRIHRMGQTKAVKTVRYIMQDTIEEVSIFSPSRRDNLDQKLQNIYELQQRKLKLAALTVSGEVQPDDHSHLEVRSILIDVNCT